MGRQMHGLPPAHCFRRLFPEPRSSTCLLVWTAGLSLGLRLVCPNFVSLTKDLRLAAGSSGNLRKTLNRATIAASSNAAGSTSHATALRNSRARFQHAA